MTEAPSPVEQAAAILGDKARRNEPLGARTTYRVGGSAALYVEIGNEDDIVSVVRAVSTTGVEVLVVGKGSNLLVADAGFAGLCVVLGEHFAEVRLDVAGREVTAGAAASSPVVARRSARAGLTGLEWLVGIPGSIGGAVRMNAGGHGSDIAAHLVSARVVALTDGRDQLLAARELDLGYRHSALRSSDLVVFARLSANAGEPTASEELIEEIVHWRRAHQPGGRNAGSVFSNPPGDAAGRLIDQAGLKGFRIGSAAVSEKHANFFQVDDRGSADDVYRLVEAVRSTVRERTGVQLSTELKLIGFGR